MLRFAERLSRTAMEHALRSVYLEMGRYAAWRLGGRNAHQRSIQAVQDQQILSKEFGEQDPVRSLAHCTRRSHVAHGARVHRIVPRPNESTTPESEPCGLRYRSHRTLAPYRRPFSEPQKAPWSHKRTLEGMATTHEFVPKGTTSARSTHIAQAR